MYGWLDECFPEIKNNCHFTQICRNLAPHLAIAAGADACVEGDETTASCETKREMPKPQMGLEDNSHEQYIYIHIYIEREREPLSVTVLIFQMHSCHPEG